MKRWRTCRGVVSVVVAWSPVGVSREAVDRKVRAAQAGSRQSRRGGTQKQDAVG
jgi:hypothetical protein